MRKSRSQTFDFKDSVTYCIKQLITIVKVVWFVLQSLEWLPKVNDRSIMINKWDDFFDFSRWSFVHQYPNEVVAFFLRRIRLNVVHNFGGNYCWLLMSAMILSGLLFHSKLLLNTLTFMVLWALISIVSIEIRFFVDAIYYNAVDTYKPIPSFKLPLNERVRNSSTRESINYIRNVPYKPTSLFAFAHQDYSHCASVAYLYISDRWIISYIHGVNNCYWMLFYTCCCETYFTIDFKASVFI